MEHNFKICKAECVMMLSWMHPSGRASEYQVALGFVLWSPFQLWILTPQALLSTDGKSQVPGLYMNNFSNYLKLEMKCVCVQVMRKS